MRIGDRYVNHSAGKYVLYPDPEVQKPGAWEVFKYRHSSSVTRIGSEVPIRATASPRGKPRALPRQCVYQHFAVWLTKADNLDCCLFTFLLSLRASAHTGVAIPRLEGKSIDNCPTGRGNSEIFGGSRYLIPFIGGIATPVCGLVRNDR